ncbi:MAG: hypothetical protein CR980_01740 [Propionibacteriales bacterium]|nr:MAG: hypothetical protein CR980_01740 [Propionibacteriales bacterium]
MFAGLGEGTAADWSSLHVVEVCLVAPEQGAVGLAAVSSCMVIIRFLGDSIVARWGRRTTAAAGGAVATVGYLLVATQSHLGIVLCGWSLVGLGVGLIAPQVYGAAGRLGGGRTLATVVTFGYTAFLAGPAVMGAIIGYFGMQHAMLFPAALCLVIVGFSRWFPNVEAN